MDYKLLIPFLFVIVPIFVFFLTIGKSSRHQTFNPNRNDRREYYRNVYLKSDEWKRKRYVVFKRDNWKCVYCGAPATQVHHKKYARINIGKEPIEWLVSVCRDCHESLHR